MDAPFGLIPITILKPLKGLDSGVEENLRSFFELDYPRFELAFSVSDPRDPARALVERLIAKNPRIRAKLFIGETSLGPNPKINNLAGAYEAAKTDWVLISDSNVRVAPDFLKRLVAHLDPGVGIVTSIVAGRNPASLGGWIEAAYLNTFFARGMSLAERVGRPCVIGKTMLFQRSVAERFGGLPVLARYLAEDYMAGEAMRKLGMKVRVACDPVPQHIGEYSAKSYRSRHLRWGRIRKAQAPIAFMSELWLGSLLPSLALFGFFASLFGLGALALPYLALWFASDLFLMKTYGGKITPLAILGWCAREITAVPLWIETLSDNRIQWRGKPLRILPGGMLETTS